MATTADGLAAACRVFAQLRTIRQHEKADRTLLTRSYFGKWAQTLLRANVELASSLIKLLRDRPALDLMLLAVTIPATQVAIPNALAPVAAFEGTTLLATQRAEPSWDLILVGVLVRFGKRYGAELLSSSSYFFGSVCRMT